ncbi:glycerophosphodiester phosphodiesterase family protein [Corynebacterium sp.]|uniref:glycerophosphodiester phosphodiesterase family protein n=1 Tax=Corynebacterium sp. TaxID=1720 RepID=UPI003736756F
MKIVSHRGNSPGFAELTPAAFEHALNLPIHGVECDVRISADGVVVVHHDVTVDRTSDGTGPVAEKTLAELRELNIGTDEDPQRMLTLDELLAMVADAGDKHLYLEIKDPLLTNQVIEEQVALRLRRAGLLADPRIHVISFSHSAMRRMARLTPELERYYLRHDREVRFNRRDVLLSRPTGLGLSIRAARARPTLVGSHGLPSYLWTVNDAEDMRFAEQLGVDVLATDDPQLALAVLDGAGPVD